MKKEELDELLSIMKGPKRDIDFDKLDKINMLCYYSIDDEISFIMVEENYYKTMCGITDNPFRGVLVGRFNINDDIARFYDPDSLDYKNPYYKKLYDDLNSVLMNFYQYSESEYGPDDSFIDNSMIDEETKTLNVNKLEEKMNNLSKYFTFKFIDGENDD